MAYFGIDLGTTYSLIGTGDKLYSGLVSSSVNVDTKRQCDRNLYGENIVSSYKVNMTTGPEGKLPITDEIYLDSSPEFKLNHIIEVERVAGGGIFTAGVIQYAFTYYMKYGAETGIVDMTPLYYISEVERGLLADETVGCSFKVKIKNPDTRFDYLRLYSIQRTSLNGTPLVKIVKDIKLK